MPDISLAPAKPRAGTLRTGGGAPPARGGSPPARWAGPTDAPDTERQSCSSDVQDLFRLEQHAGPALWVWRLRRVLGSLALRQQRLDLLELPDMARMRCRALKFGRRERGGSNAGRLACVVADQGIQLRVGLALDRRRRDVECPDLLERSASLSPGYASRSPGPHAASSLRELEKQESDRRGGNDQQTDADRLGERDTAGQSLQWPRIANLRGHLRVRQRAAQRQRQGRDADFARRR